MRVIGSPVNADRDLTSEVAVYIATPDATNPTLIVVDVVLGDGTKNLDGTGGVFELAVEIGGVRFDGATQEKTVAAGAVRVRFQTVQLLVPANTTLAVKVTSPNAADTDVDTVATLYDVNDAALAEYPDGFVILDPTNGTAGTVVGVNGTEANPSSNFADAATIASARNRKSIRLREKGNVSITTGTFSGYTVDLFGAGLTVSDAAALQAARVFSSLPNASYVGPGLPQDLLLKSGFTENVLLRNTRFEGYHYLTKCVLAGTLTLTTVDDGEIALFSCYVEQSDGCTVDFSVSGTQTFFLQDCWGDFTVDNMIAGQTFIYYGWGKLTINASCTGGTVRYTSHVEVVDNSGGAVTLELVSDGSLAADIAAIAAAGTTVTVAATAVAAVAANDSGQLTMVRYSTFRTRFTGLSSLAGRTSFKFTLKPSISTLGTTADSGALLQVDEDNGLEIVNGAVWAGDSALASLVYVSDTSADLYIDETITGLLTAGVKKPYSLKLFDSAGDDTEITSVDYPEGAQTYARVLNGVSQSV